MTQTRATSTRPQMALQSYLDGLLQEATEADDLGEPTATADEFAEAVREEQARDARQPARAGAVATRAPGSPPPLAPPLPHLVL